MPLSTQDLLEKAKDQRKRERYDEALLSARAAAMADPDDADAWWHVALNLTSLNRTHDAVNAYEKTVALAPTFSAGWERLGYALEALKRFDEARVVLERALAEGPDETDESDIIEALSRVYLELSSTTKEYADREIAVLHRVEGLTYLDANQSSRLGILHYNRKDFFEAIKYWERGVADGDPGPWNRFNLGLAYNNPEVSQDADAIDMWRLVLEEHPEHSRASERIKSVLPRLLTLAESARSAGETLLSRDQWYEHYVNPFDLLNVIEEVDLDEVVQGTLGPKVFQRLRKRLLQEIELEDGAVSWMEGLVIDRSRAIRVCDELQNDQSAAYHWIVFLNDPLLDFLSRGCHEHFLVDVDGSPFDVINKLEADDGFRQWLGAEFWPQYSRVLCKTINQRCLPVIEILFDGRRWIPPEHVDQCFEASRHMVDGLLEPLRQLRAKGAAVFAAVNAALVYQNLSDILNLLPAQFRRIQSEAASLVRGMAVDCYNVNEDADQSLKILELTKRLQFKSAELNAHLDDDFVQIRELIEKEHQNEVKETVGNVLCVITKEVVSHGSVNVPVNEISDVGWGARTSQGTTGRTKVDYMVRFRTYSGRELRYGWQSDGSTELSKRCEDLFGRMLGAALTYIVPGLVQRVRRSLDTGATLAIGPCTVSTRGVGFQTRGWFLSKDHMVPWGSLAITVQNGDVIASNRWQPDTKTSLSLWDVYNAPLLALLKTTLENET